MVELAGWVVHSLYFPQLILIRLVKLFLQLQQLMPFTKCIIATGGGAVIRRKNWGYMQHGVVIWLDGSPELLASHVLGQSGGTKSRPLIFSNTDVQEQVSTFFTNSFYHCQSRQQMILLHCTRVGWLSKCSYSVLTMYLTYSYDETHPSGIMTVSQLLIHNITDEQQVISVVMGCNIAPTLNQICKGLV